MELRKLRTFDASGEIFECVLYRTAMLIKIEGAMHIRVHFYN